VSQVFGVDPIVALAAIGAAVPGLAELGTSVVPLTGRHPLALAAEARTAQSALDGRFTLGVGTSHRMVAEGFFGEPFVRQGLAHHRRRTHPGAPRGTWSTHADVGRSRRVGNVRRLALVGVCVCVTDDPEAVRSRSREHSQMYDSFPSYRAMLDREGVASGADLLLAGSFDRVAEGLAAYAAAGATDLRIMVHAGNDDERQATREALASALKRRLTA